MGDNFFKRDSHVVLGSGKKDPWIYDSLKKRFVKNPNAKLMKPYLDVMNDGKITLCSGTKRGNSITAKSVKVLMRKEFKHPISYIGFEKNYYSLKIGKSISKKDARKLMKLRLISVYFLEKKLSESVIKMFCEHIYDNTGSGSVVEVRKFKPGFIAKIKRILRLSSE